MYSTSAQNLFRKQFNLKESRCSIITDKEDFYKIATNAIIKHRRELEGYIEVHPEFQFSLSPIKTVDAPVSAHRMSQAGEKAGVGPMAAVAGVIADLAVEDMVQAGARVAIVEDGGEASLVSDHPIDIALKAGKTELSQRVGFRFKDFPVGVATSSGLYSHALSFGEADAATVFALNAGLADAVATAVGNTLTGKDTAEAIRKGLQTGLDIEGVYGVFIIYGGKVGTAGVLPQIIGINSD